MANSTTNLDQISSGQAQKEVTANALFDVLSQAALYGRRASTTTGLTWGFFGGNLTAGPGGIIAIANATVALTASLTNYVEADPVTGVVTSNTTAFTPGKLPLYTVLTGTSTITSYVDVRPGLVGTKSYLIQKSVAGAGDIVLTSDDLRRDIIEFTGAISGNRNVILPAYVGKLQVENLTSGNFKLTVKTQAGTGVEVPRNRTFSIYCNGTNVEDAASGKENRVKGILKLFDTGAVAIEDDVVICDATTYSYSVALPLASEGRYRKHFKKVDAGVNTITVYCVGSDLIDGVGYKTLTTVNEVICLQSDGVDKWYVL